VPMTIKIVAAADAGAQRVTTMKIALSLTGNEDDAKVSERFGRCPYFLLIDTGSGEKKIISNTGASDSSGAGIRAAQLIVDNGAETVITGRVGPNAYTLLAKVGVPIYVVVRNTDIIEALRLYQEGALERQELQRF